MIKIEPTNNNVVVRLDDPPKVKGSIVLPDNAKADDSYRTGVVLAVGPGAEETWVTDSGPVSKRRAPDVKVGDHVLLDKYSAAGPLDIGGAQVIVLDECNIVGVLRDE